MKLTKRPNRLINEKSPYLLQHAYNPVDWYPWGDEAFEKAKTEGKPIFLSIGYSTCHWCHVMEKESFVDPEVADVLNETFISIKVDREERPDLDSVYMSVCQKMTGSGGWPLTILMTPDRKPFFAETYLPKKSSFGRIGIMELAKKVKELWQNRREEVERLAGENISYLQPETPARSGLDIRLDILEKAYQHLVELYDEQYGGFGYAPKFPTPHNFGFLMRYWKRTGNQQALDMVVKTLKAMRRGGIYDQLGYGFHRYSTDNRWFAPHFEKMLYDQALLATAYLEAYQITGTDLFRRTASEIFDYTLTVMRDEKGGFYTAEDADSEGVEGKFYLWSLNELKEILSFQEMQLMAAYFNLEDKGNYQEGSSNLGKGVNILHIKEELSSIARNLNIDLKMAENLLQSARDKLYTAREKRVHPFKDDKILMDWNGLLIAALAKGGRILKDRRFTEAAEKTVEFFLTNMRTPQGFFFRRYRKGEAAIPAFLEDYTFFIWGLIELYESTFKPDYLTRALELNQFLLLHFLDKENGGFFQTSDQSEEVLVRNKEVFDGAIPSGNSVAMLNLIRLARLTGNPSLEQEARRITQAFAETILVSPAYYTQFLSALDFAFGPSFELVIVGQQGRKETEKMIEAIEKTFAPNKVVLFRSTDEENPEIISINSFLKELTEIEGKTTAYVCRNYHCNLPTTDPYKMIELLKGERNGS